MMKQVNIKTIKICAFLLMVTLMLLGTGCGKLPEKRHPLVLKALKLKEKGSFPEAARYYEEYLMKNPKSFQIHKDVAALYYDYLNDPFMAAYHYRQCLKFLPKDGDETSIKAWLVDAEKKYFEELKTQYSDANEEIIKELKSKLFTVESQNTKFRHYLALYIKKSKDLKTKLQEAAKSKPIPVSAVALPSSPKTSTDNAATTAPKPSGNHSFYIVQKGDSLIKISKKVYGTTKHYQLIYDANKHILPSMSRLSLGQRLVIPALPGHLKATPKPKETE